MVDPLTGLEPPQRIRHPVGLPVFGLIEISREN